MNQNGKDILAESVLCFLVNGLASKLHQVVCFYPVKNPDANFLQECFWDTVMCLENVGFKMLMSVCDNHPTNRKLYSTLTGKHMDEVEQTPLVKNPYADRDIILMFDPIQIIKCIRNNCFSKKDWDIRSKNGNISWSLLKKITFT